MDEFKDGFAEAWRLLLSGDPEVLAITLRTIGIALASTAISMAIGVPLGYLLARTRFRGRTWILGLMNTAMGTPPVVAGLVVWLLLVRSGPFGSFELIYTKEAMVIAEITLATPIIVGFTTASIQALPPELPDLLAILGAGRLRTMWLIAREAKLGVLAAVMAGFGAVASEVGAAMTVGGNLQGSTRVLTTAIVTETSRGRADRALALGVLLLGLAFSVSLLLTAVQQRRAPSPSA